MPDHLGGVPLNVGKRKHLGTKEEITIGPINPAATQKIHRAKYRKDFKGSPMEPSVRQPNVKQPLLRQTGRTKQ